MDKAHQKELAKNDLEAGLEKVASSVRPYYAPLALLAAVAMIAAIAYMIYERNVRSANSAAWNKWSLVVLDRDPDSEVLRKVGEELGNTSASHWALQLAADEDLREGSFLIYEDRELARQKLESALDLYEQVLKNATDDVMLQTRAHYGAARASECLFKTEEAIEHYQQIVNSEASDTALGKAAKAKIDQLKTDEAKDFYKWFATQEPYKPTAGGNSGRLNSLPGLPDVPDITIPGLGGAKGPDPGKNNSGAEGEKTPELDLSKPAGERENTPSKFEDKPPADPAPSDPPSSEPAPPDPAPAGEVPK